MNRFPKRPTGSDAEALFDQAVWDAVFGPGSQFVNSSTVKVNQTTRGISFTAAPAGSGGTSLIQCVVTSIDLSGGYIGVTEYDLENDSLTGSEFNCAKAYTTRQPFTQLIDGDIVKYEYIDDNTRYAQIADAVVERHVVHPRYIEYEDPLPAGANINQYLILVSKTKNSIGIDDSDGNPITFIEAGPFRDWAYSANQGGVPPNVP